MDDIGYNFKTVIIGDSGCGKTSLIDRITNDRFLSDKNSTIGVEFNTKVLKDTTLLKFRMWDIGGQFAGIVGSYLKDCYCVIIVYDVTNEQSFYSLKEWMDYVKKYVTNKNCMLVLVGNKSDEKEKIAVDKNRALIFQIDNEIDLFREVSAKDGTNVKELFSKIKEDLLQKIENGNIQLEKTPFNSNKPDVKDRTISWKNCFGFI